MSEFLFKVCGLAVLSAMLVSLLKKWGADMAVVLKIAAGIALAATCFGAVSPIVEYLAEISVSYDVVEAAGFMLRVLAVALVTHICANICRDCGESTLASYMELGGKVEIILLSLPAIKKIIETAVGMI